MKQRITLYAEDGMILTDGEHFGTVIHLATDADADLWHEITREEYERILAQQEETENT